MALHCCALQVIDKFLKILEVIVMEPGQAFKALLPGIIDICMQEVYPIVAEVRACFCKTSLPVQRYTLRFLLCRPVSGTKK